MSFEDKNVFVTGGAGFIGSTLVRELLKEKANVTVYDNFVSGSPENLKEVKDKVKVIKGDILDEGLAKVLKENKAEYVFNLAALPYIPHCYDKPRDFFDVCAKGALNVMLCGKEAGVERIVQYSSSEVYGTAKEVPMTEDHPTLPLSTYAVSKLAADRLCYTLHHEQDIPVIILRQFNVFGPRETHPYIIPELITQLSETNELKLGNVEARRDLLYVTDAAKGAMSLMKNSRAVGGVFNCGTGKDWSVKEMAESIAEIIGRENLSITVEKERLRPLDVQRLQADYSKIKKLTGWEPEVSFKEGLQKTVEWFNENDKKWLWEKTFGTEEEIWEEK
jgi:nucleoside-diphosphate-sugar epimerase